MSIKVRATLGTLAGLFALAGCRTTPHSSAALAVGEAVRARTESAAGLEVPPAAVMEKTRIQALLADGLSLEDALRIAIVRNAELRAEYEDVNIAHADLVQAGLPGNPSFDGALRFVEGGGGEIVEAAIMQPIVALLLAPQRRRVAKADLCAVRARLIAAGLRVLGEVRRRWYGLVAAEQTSELHGTATLAARAASEAAAELRRAGNITSLDAHREQTFYEEQRAVLAQAQLDAYAARELLNEKLGLGGDLTTWAIVNRLPDLPQASAVAADLETRAVHASQDLAHRRLQMIALGRRLGLTCVESVVRDVGVGVAAEREASGEWSVGPAIALEIPIFDYGQASVPRARALLRQAMLRYVARGVEVRTRSRIEAETLGAAWRQARHAKDVMMPLRQKMLEETLKQSNAMQIGVFHVLQAKRELVSAAQHYVETLHQYWASRSRVDQIVAGALPEPVPMMGD